MLRLLKNLHLEYGSDLSQALAAYEEATSTNSGAPTLHQLISDGWARLVWGRVEVSLETSVALSRNKNRAGAFSRVLEERCKEKIKICENSDLQGETLLIAKELEQGTLTFQALSCPQPAWVAARLWEWLDVAHNKAHSMRSWIDRFKVLGAPHFSPSKMLDGNAAESFRQAALETAENKNNLEDWNTARDHFLQEIAVISGKDVAEVGGYLPALPITLVERAIWLEDARLQRYTQSSLQVFNDILLLSHILLTEVDEQAFSAAPHPIAVRLFDLGGSRPILLLHLLYAVRSKPRLLADLILYPPTCCLACLIISRWRLTASIFDRELLEHDHKIARGSAFDDAVSLLTWWLEEGSLASEEVAELLTWFQNSSYTAVATDRIADKSLRISLRDALLPVNSAKITEIIGRLMQRYDESEGLGGRFAAAVELVALGDLSQQLDPAPFIEAYCNGFAVDNARPSTQNIGAQSAAALLKLAERSPELLEKFLYPFDISEYLTRAHAAGDNQFTETLQLSRSLRAHIRVLSRAITGNGQPTSERVVDALASAVWHGALKHDERARVAAFASRHESGVFAMLGERSIAFDLADALTTLVGDHRETLLSVILETDEPMVLAQLLPLTPREAHLRITRRLNDLPPSRSGEVLFWDEFQSRISELISAGAVEAAEKFIAEEAHLFGERAIQGRAITRLRSKLRLLFARGAWDEIAKFDLPDDFELQDSNEASDTILFFKALAQLSGPSRDSEDAETIFRGLWERRPSVSAYAVNTFAAKISTLLKGDVFGRLTGDRVRDARHVLVEMRSLATGQANLTPADRDILALNQALLTLALGEPAEALSLLPTSISVQFEEGAQAYRVVALSRLGRSSEAQALLRISRTNLGDTELLRAADAQVRVGASFDGTIGVVESDDPVLSVRQAHQALLGLDAWQQAAVLRIGTEPLNGFIIRQVRAAAASIVTLVRVVKIHSENDATTVIRELLQCRLAFLKWSVLDQSLRGVTAKGNAGECDLLVSHENVPLAAVEAVVCDESASRPSIQANLIFHYEKLLRYVKCRLYFHLTYLYNQDIGELIKQLKLIAGQHSPANYVVGGLEDLELTDMRPSGFIANYTDEQGPLAVVFLVLDMTVQRLPSRR